jgi:UDP-N-acetylmuramoylalanine--D-glutamate ligase
MIGEAAPKIEAQLSGVVPDLMKANSMAEAVRMARKMAKRGEIVLLSPACSSFDMFENYEQRGEVFKREVLSL